MDILNIIRYAIDKNASDIHITVGISPTVRVNGTLIPFDDMLLNASDTENLVKQVLNDFQFKQVEECGQVDISYSIPEIGRFRVNVYKQRGNYGMAIRIIPMMVPSIEELGLPNVIKDLARLPRGLILVTGPSGSGKSTTLASMVNLINQEKSYHIVTLEDPIEYVHEHNNSIVNQREIGVDTNSFSDALRAALRQDPDVILVGEMRDLDTMSTVLTAAETGHLVLSTLHTVGAAKTINRIIDVFPPHQQQQVRVQLSSVIQAIISQQLILKSDNNSLVVASEIMVATTAIRNLIREGKVYQIDTSIQTGAKFGMNTMDKSLLELYRNKIIAKETVLKQAVDLDYVQSFLN